MGTVLDAIRKGTKEVIEGLKWPKRKNMIKRAFEAFADKVEIKQDEVDQKIIDLQKSLTEVTEDSEAKEIIKKIVEARLELEAVQKTASVAEEVHNYLFSPEANLEGKEDVQST